MASCRPGRVRSTAVPVPFPCSGRVKREGVKVKSKEGGGPESVREAGGRAIWEWLAEGPWRRAECTKEVGCSEERCEDCRWRRVVS